MSKIAFLFPGQASQYVGMGRELVDQFPVARKVFEEADEALQAAVPLRGSVCSISKICFEGSEEDLKLTANTQPAILTVSVAAWRALEEKNVQPDFVAGHSLGEYSALVAAGALTLRDAVVTVRKRGQYMQDAVPVGAGAMAAILGLPLETAREICDEAAQGEIVSPANINSPHQMVISGNAAAVERAAKLASARGAKRAILLPVSAPFHCALMRPAQERLEKDLRALPFSDLRIPLVTNVDAKLIGSGAEARESLVRQVSAPVRWVECVQRLIENGVSTFVEVGPGKVLSGLVKSIDKSVKLLNVEDEKSLNATLAALG